MKKKSLLKKLKRTIILLMIALFLILGFLLYANWVIPHNTQSFLYNNTDAIPKQKAALVLGTAQYTKRGYLNPYFINRMQAAKELYDSGKVSFFILSGDNKHRSYNEPRDMQKALMKLGVPDSIIYLDYAGFRTLDSVVRMKKIFGQDSFIVVSQKFHNERAIFIGQHHNLNIYGYNAKDVALRMSYKVMIREKFARVKVFLDIIFGKKPKFLGDPIEVK